MIRVFIVFLLFSTAAFAQPVTSSSRAPQAATPTEQALGIKLSNEISQGLQCSAAVITGQQEADKMKARIKELEEKYEPKSK